MKVNLFCMPTVPATLEERRELRPIGRNRERYQMMIDELRDLAVMADDYGVTAFSTTEHHFHTEGGEANPNPVLMFADLAARTKNILVMPASIVLSAANPIRVAEDMALLDHLTKGRTAVAFARGYQKRWVQVVSQGGPIADHHDAEANRLNALKFDEALDVVVKAWQNDAFDYSGQTFQVPFPHAEGISGWGPVEWTRRYGAEGEIDDAGVIRKIGTVPAPYQSPHPPVFLVYISSPETSLKAAQRGFGMSVFPSIPAEFRAIAERYQAEAAAAGHALKLGERLMFNRCLTIGDTYEEAFDLAVKTTGREFFEYFAHFGMMESFRDPKLDDPNKPMVFKDARELTQRLVERKFQLVGTVDQVRQQMEDVYTVHGAGGEVEWFHWTFFYQGTTPRDTWKRQLELFAEKVWPTFQ
jgi:alkanesulfonate monooxygenase SsuD/methylene tetrahydromethanopterin reductase-like flavin-dependent oxidoreductase (luciferase family)